MKLPFTTARSRYMENTATASVPKNGKNPSKNVRNVFKNGAYGGVNSIYAMMWMIHSAESNAEMKPPISLKYGTNGL